jgi:DNA topoisomerase-2
MVLVNGSKGIGTGFSTEIMCYNPVQIITYIKNKLQNITNYANEFLPYYEGFTGSISRLNDNKFLFKGTYEKVEQDKIKVTELPIGYWTEDFKELLNDLQNDKDKEGKKIVPFVKDVYENYTDTTVEFVITFSKGKIDELEKASGDYGCNGLEKLLKLYSTSSTTNMNLFNAEDKLTKYDSIDAIIDDYFGIRLGYYNDRKMNLIENLERELLILSNKVRYIQEVLAGTIDLRKKKKQEITNLLQGKKYAMMDEDEEYKYLIRMPMDSVSEENVEKLVTEHSSKSAELICIKNTTIQQMWLKELDILENEYKEYQKERALAQQGDVKTTKKKTVAKKTVKKNVNLVFEE